MILVQLESGDTKSLCVLVIMHLVTRRAFCSLCGNLTSMHGMDMESWATFQQAQWVTEVQGSKLPTSDGRTQARLAHQADVHRNVGNCGVSCLPKPAYEASLHLQWVASSDIAALSPSGSMPFPGSGLMLPNQPVWKHDPWSRKGPQAALQQNPPAPLSHHRLFIITPEFSPPVTSHWNATFVRASSKSLWTAVPLE